MTGDLFKKAFEAQGVAFQVAWGRPGADLSRLSVAPLAFRDETFQLVAFPGSIACFDRPEAALAEAWRLLKPGGRIYVDHELPGPRFWEEHPFGRLRILASRWAGTLDEAGEPVKPRWIPPGSLLSALWRVGFRNLDTRVVQPALQETEEALRLQEKACFRALERMPDPAHPLYLARRATLDRLLQEIHAHPVLAPPRLGILATKLPSPLPSPHRARTIPCPT